VSAGSAGLKIQVHTIGLTPYSNLKCLFQPKSE